LTVSGSRAQQALSGYGIARLAGRALHQRGATFADGGSPVVVAVTERLLLLIVSKD
jgi:hypothetical protein